jgi:hypothetical protein
MQKDRSCPLMVPTPLDEVSAPRLHTGPSGFRWLLNPAWRWITEAGLDQESQGPDIGGRQS